ncbi:MAG: DUF370 domain-containing protein [Clostridia bacterium]|nr:DUF370 domain-containing protein [Clostridia bacterium]
MKSSGYLFIGNNTIIRERDIIGIFDTDSATADSPITKKYLADAEKQGFTEFTGSDIPKSFIVYIHRTEGKPDGYRICFSELASSVLLQRSGLAG